MNTESFILEIETDDVFEDTKEDLKEWFDTSNYHKDMVLPKEYAKNANVNKNVIGKMNSSYVNSSLYHLKYMLISKFLLIKHFQKIKKLEAQVKRLLKRP